MKKMNDFARDVCVGLASELSDGSVEATAISVTTPDEGRKMVMIEVRPTQRPSPPLEIVTPPGGVPRCPICDRAAPSGMCEPCNLEL